MVSLSNCNIIADFIISEKPLLMHLADVRAVRAVRRLRLVLAAAKAKQVVSTSTAPPAADITNPKEATVAGSNTTMASDGDAPTDGAVVTEELPKAVDDSVKEGSGPIVEENESKTDHNIAMEEGEDEESLCPEEEARIWRRKFVAACR